MPELKKLLPKWITPEDADNTDKFRIVCSYAGEDSPFVEEIVSVLRVYFHQIAEIDVEGSGKVRCPHVYCYTEAGKPRITDDHLATVAFNRILSVSNVLVFFTSNDHVYEGPTTDDVEAHSAMGQSLWQLNEYEAWRSSTSHTSRKDTYEIQVDFDDVPMTQTERAAHRWALCSDQACLPTARSIGDNFLKLNAEGFGYSSASWVAEQILRFLLFGQREAEIPHAPQICSYEKSIVEVYQRVPHIMAGGDVEERRLLLGAIRAGLPSEWPAVELRTDIDTSIENDKTDRIGKVRHRHAPLWPTDFTANGISVDNRIADTVVVAALSNYHSRDTCAGCLVRDRLVFPAAGPRSKLLNAHACPDGALNAAILVSGGIAPGINAVIDGIVRRHKLYNDNVALRTAALWGIKNGFWGLLHGNYHMWEDLIDTDTSRYATMGGSYLRTFRLDAILEDEKRDETLARIKNTLDATHISILYIIGGDGSMKAAHLLSLYCKRNGFPISIIGVPKTMDNDILWMWQSFGFATAVEKAREIINDLATEAHSNPRICVLQLFGSSSGYVVSHAVLASQTGQCDVALIPEARFSIKAIARDLLTRSCDAMNPRPVPYGMIVMAEAAIPDDYKDYLENPDIGLVEEEKDAIVAFCKEREVGKYPQGQTPDKLRTGGLKLVMQGVKLELKELIAGEQRGVHLFGDDMRVFSNEPRHILRSTSPSFSDIIMGQRLGALAVDNAMAGYTDFMVSQWLTEYVLVPLRLVGLGRKRIPETGIFWKSVLAKTGQGNP